MQVRVTRENITDEELAKALSSYISNEHLTSKVVELLSKKEHNHVGEEIPERYLRQIEKKLNITTRSLMTTLVQNIEKWFKGKSTFKKNILSKRSGVPPTLTEAQVAELRLLIESHFRSAIGLGYKVPSSLQRQWNKYGIVPPEQDLETWINQSYVAGRLSFVLANGDTYADMVKLVAKIPLNRVDELILMQAKQNAARFVTGFGRKLADKAEDIILANEKKNLNLIIQSYFSGDLKITKYNEEGLSREEMSILESDRSVKGWQELSSELRSRFKQEDISRDWDRIAQTEIRYSTNLGKLASIQHEGGGDADEIEVYYHVQPIACASCKKLYLNPDGTPKIFKLSEILHNVARTGGMNVGLTASKIGKEGGWLPNASTHPHCHCYPIQYMREYGTVT